MPNYPTSLDALANPTATTRRDDPGFELDVVISTLNDIAEALESKLGITDAPAADAPVANRVLASLGAGRSGWAQIATAMLAANAVTQIGFARGITASPGTSSTSPTDQPDLAVTLTTGGGDLLVFGGGPVNNNTSGQGVNVGLRLDAGADDFVAAMTATTPGYNAQLVTACRYTGVSAASHTVKVRWWVTGGTGVAFGIGRFLIVVEVKR